MTSFYTIWIVWISGGGRMTRSLSMAQSASVGCVLCVMFWQFIETIGLA